jgi:hypothetical protein
MWPTHYLDIVTRLVDTNKKTLLEYYSYPFSGEGLYGFFDDMNVSW